MKTRIKKATRRDGLVLFIPQRKILGLFWFSWYYCDEDYGFMLRSFTDISGAIKFLRDIEAGPFVKKEYIYPENFND